MKKIVLTRYIDYLADAERTLAQQFEVVRPAGTSEPELVEAARDASALIMITGVKITEPVIAAAPRLEAIATPAVGFDGIDVEAATRAGVPVIANLGVSPESVAEFTLGLMIALSRRIVRSDRDVHATHDWSRRPPYFDAQRELGIELHGATVGVVGVGQIGSALVRMGRAAFSMNFLGYDPFLSAERMAEQGVTRVDDLLELARQSDFVLLHLPLTKDTRHIIGAEVLRAMKPSAFLINCARGPVVDEAALVTALREGWIAGAGLDVLEQEPLTAANPLLDLDNVIMTPHIAGVSRESNQRRAAELARRLGTVLTGGRPDGIVNPDVWPRFLERRGALQG